MSHIQPIDKDTVKVVCSDKTTIIQTEDTIVFTEEYLDFSVGETRTVEPIKDEGEVHLMCREDNRRIREHGIVELVCEEIVTIQ